jgi:hypothetical protein
MKENDENGTAKKNKYNSIIMRRMEHNWKKMSFI